MRIIYIIIYLIFMNLCAFISMGIDKEKAKHHKWRISERTLFLLAVLGGSAGSILGMRFFRHKTKHRSFSLGMPVILCVQIGILMCLYLR